MTTHYINCVSSPFSLDESLSDDNSQTFMTPSSTEKFSQKTITPSNTLTPSNTSNQNFAQESTPFVPSNESTPFVPSNHKSLTPPTNDNTLYKDIINTPHTNIPADRTRHSSQNQTRHCSQNILLSLPPLIDRTTKTT